jgi:rfaE bifunctional protein kinase chain/domain
MNSTEITFLPALFEQISRLKVGVIGDFALDMYFDLNTQTGEGSIETGLDVHWGARPQASPGAAGNVVQNLLALGVGQVWVVGCVGPDLFGREMRHLFDRQGVRTQYLITVERGWDTCVYTKPMEAGQEANRIDFGSRNALPDEQFAHLLNSLRELLPQLDALIINGQFLHPLLTPDRLPALNDLLRQHSNVRFVADLRDSGFRMRGVTLKVNTAELARFQKVTLPKEPDTDWCLVHGRALAETIDGPVVVTRGEAGILYVSQTESHAVAGLQLPSPLDTVGAGDTVVAALTASLAAGASPSQALILANLAAAVTVQKIGQTGTASPEEIMLINS